MSFPHFYQADDKFVSAIGGMHPNKEYHETFVDINPVSTHVFLVKKQTFYSVYTVFTSLALSTLEKYIVFLSFIYSSGRNSAQCNVMRSLMTQPLER